MSSRRQKLNIALVVGTRPELIKTVPVVHELQRRGLDFFLLHTGQHYSYELDRVFFEELRIPDPKYNLRVGSGTHAQETGKMIIGIERIFLKERPDIALVEGDTNTVLAGALAAAKLHIRVGHIEAGLRCFDMRMPEELNRVVTDHVSDYLFAPTLQSKRNLVNEGIFPRRIHVTGNTVVDAIHEFIPDSASSNNEPDTKPYFLLTLHRQENVDIRPRLAQILEGVRSAAKSSGCRVIFPVHPRTAKRLARFRLRLDTSTFRLVLPMGYISFLELARRARLILTDSGGVQEEACVLRVPCVTLRENTERPETVSVGANEIAGTVPRRIVRKAQIMLKRQRKWKIPLGDGRASERIVRILERQQHSLLKSAC